VLKKLAVNKGNKAKIVVAGGTAVIVFVMLKEHPISCKIVQEYGCRVSVNLAENNSENQLQIASSDGISVILAVMLEHSKHAGVQGHVAGVLKWCPKALYCFLVSFQDTSRTE